MGFLDIFGKTKKQTDGQVEKKTKQKEETRKVEKTQDNIRVEYHEVLYSQDYTGKRKRVSPAPPRREWENITTVEKKIDELTVEEKKKAFSAAAVEKKVDRLLSTKLGK